MNRALRRLVERHFENEHYIKEKQREIKSKEQELKTMYKQVEELELENEDIEAVVAKAGKDFKSVVNDYFTVGYGSLF